VDKSPNQLKNMQTETTQPQAFILKAKSGQWSWELHIDGELHQAGAGYDTEGDAIEGLYEANSHIEGINLVLSKDASHASL